MAVMQAELSGFWNGAGGVMPEGTVLEHGPGEQRAASGVRPAQSPALPGGSAGRPGARE